MVVFWGSTLLRSFWRFGGTYCLYLQGTQLVNLITLASTWADSGTLKVDAVLSPEASKTKLTTPRENATRSRELAFWNFGHGLSPTFVHWAQAAVPVVVVVVVVVLQ
jgi:hypothetical protein